MLDVKVILKYNRENICWECPDCSTEVSLKEGKCSVCGYKKVGDEFIIRPVDEEPEITRPVARKRVEPTPVRKIPDRVFEDEERATWGKKPEEKKDYTLLITLIVIIAVVAVLIMMSNGGYIRDMGVEYGVSCLNVFVPETAAPVNQTIENFVDYTLLYGIGG